MAVGALAFCQAGRSLQWCLLLLSLSVALARPRRFLVVFEGAVRHPPSVPVRSLFRRPAGGPWLAAPCRALAALVLAAGLWLRGPGKSS